jgi:sigma-B regulation protein RsbU (phosphoserine phosphatase)
VNAPAEGVAPGAPEASRLERELARQRKVAEASYALHTTLDLDELLKLLLATARDGVDADRGTVFLVSDDRTEIWSRVVAGDSSLVIRQPLGKGISGTVAATGETIRIADAHRDPRFDASWDKKSGYRTRQILCAPIRARDGRIVGVFQLLNKRGAADFDADDETFLEALSIHAALAVENARLHRASLEKERQDREIALVQGVQRAFQPERDARDAGVFRIAGMNELCEDASGDYYDFVERRDGRLLVALGDVSGHGLGSALVMAQARSFLRAFLHTVDGLADVVTLLNDFLAQDLSGGRFLSLFVGILDPRTGRLEACNAGHLPPLLVRADGAVETLAANGLVVGVVAGVPYDTHPPVEVRPGDLLLLYTDGCTEAASPSGELFGEARLTALARSLRGRPPPDVLDEVRRALLDWTGKPRLRDDLTLVAVYRAEAASPAPPPAATSS